MRADKARNQYPQVDVAGVTLESPRGSASNALNSCRRAQLTFSKNAVTIFFVVGGFLALSWLPLLHGFLGATWIVFWCLVFPSLSPYGLLAAASIQDAPGLPSGLTYPTYALLAFTLICSYWLRIVIVKHRRGTTAANSEARHRQLVLAVIVTVIYGLCLTLIGHYLGTREIGVRRPPFLVVIFMIAAVVAGYAAAKSVQTRRAGTEALLVCVTLVLLNAFFAMLTQLAWGFKAYRSPEGVSSLLTSSQFTQGTVLGFPRLTGTYLSPDTFGIFILLLIVLRLALLGRIKGSVGPLSFWLNVGLASFIVLATMSKNVALLFLLVFGFAVIRRLRVRVMALVAVLLVAILLLGAVENLSIFDTLSGALRVPSASELHHTYRYMIWMAALAKLSVIDWVVGTGVSYWPVILQFATPGGEANPHSWLLNVLGEFGIFGIFVYFFVAINLYCAWKASDPHLRLLIFAIIVAIFVCGFFDVGLLFGQSPFNFFVWFILALIALWVSEPKKTMEHGITVHA